ncbi:MAG: saccharopine dehydrogenase C-terminal domain-containing protein [Flavobacteriales bacterium]
MGHGLRIFAPTIRTAMRSILVLGAGRSATSLIHYLIAHAREHQWRLIVGDRDLAHAQGLVAGASEVARAIALDATDNEARMHAIDRSDVVISMLPAFMHMAVVKDCIHARKHVITPSYVPDELWALEGAVRDAGIVSLNELGLDPGIDHMSAMRILDRIRAEGGTMQAFESHTGGLVAPGSDTDPWGYKFSWNPRNVVLAGQGGAARYVQDGATRYIPYHKLFSRTVQVTVPGYGEYEGYANRDSLKYRKFYGLDGIPTLLRGTVRKAGFCAAWDALVRLGCTDDSYPMELPEDATWLHYLEAFLPPGSGSSPQQVLADYLGLDVGGEVVAKLAWLGLFGDGPIGHSGLSPAATLQTLLERKWMLAPHDKDLVVMWHRFVYSLDGVEHEINASLAVEGDDQRNTAMAKTVGLPLGIATKLVLNGDVTQRGVLLPLEPTIYDPVLDELETLGIRFVEEQVA